MSRNKVEVRVGRLLEVTLIDPLETDQEVDAIMRETRRALENIPIEEQIVTAADWRQVMTIMSPAASERMLDLLRHANPRTARSALLYSDRSPTAVMQFFRLLKLSDNPNRQMFSSPHEMADWLSKALNDAESRRLRQFLGIAE